MTYGSGGRETIQRIRRLVQTGGLPPVFTPALVNQALGIHWAGTFLPKHSAGNPGGDTELFVRIRRGVYRLF